MKPDLIMLTNNYPNCPLTSESWLADEIQFSHNWFNSVQIIPNYDSGKYVKLPKNCEVINWNSQAKLRLNFIEKLKCIKIVLSDFTNYSNKLIFFKSFRYNLSQIKYLQLKANSIQIKNKRDPSNTILYAYWSDNLLTTACLLKQKSHFFRIVSRAHGFDIFEDQNKNGVIPFRKFQLKITDIMISVSNAGLKHLSEKHVDFKSKFSTSYLGNFEYGENPFFLTNNFSMVTCSIIRSVKRLELMSDILQNIKFNLVWHVIGNGPDLIKLKERVKKLPKNISVNFYGLLSEKEVINFYCSTPVNLFLSLSYSEGLPVSMMEALSFGIPIMSTDVGGCSEICNDNTGILIPKDFDAKEVADRITEFKNSKKNNLEFRNQCKDYWNKNFSAEINYTKFAKQILEI